MNTNVTLDIVNDIVINRFPGACSKKGTGTQTIGAPFYKVILLLLAFVLSGNVMVEVNAQTTVSYVEQTGYFTAGSSWSDNGGSYNPNAYQVGLWAHGGGNKQIVLWRQFKTDGLNAGTARSLKVGDEFRISSSAHTNFGEMGFSLLCSPTSRSSWNDRLNNASISINLSNYGNWYARYFDGTTVNAATSTGTANIGGNTSYKNFVFTCLLTAPNRMNVTITDGTTTSYLYDLLLNNSSPITEYAIYLCDDWDGSAPNDRFWGTSSTSNTDYVKNTKTIPIGGSNSSFTISGALPDGYDAGSTSTVSNNALTKSGSGTLTLSAANTYTGITNISAGTLTFGATNAIPSGATGVQSAVTINGGTLSTGASSAGFSCGTATYPMGILTVGASGGTIALAATSSSQRLYFANSSGATWGGGTLNITGWAGSIGSTGTNGKIYIGGGIGALIAGQLSKITFSGITGSTGAMLMSDGELVPAALPTITSFSASPNNGTSTTGYIGSTVTITGTNFTGATKVTVGGTDLSCSVTDAQHLTFTTTVATGTITATTGSGTSAASGTAYASAGYISAATGNWDGSTTATWLGGSIPTSGSTVTIASSNTVTLAATATVSSLIINSGGTFNNGTAQTLNISAAGTLTNNGTYTAATGKISFAGNATISGTAAISLYDMSFASGSTISVSTPVTSSQIFNMSSNNTYTFSFTNNATFTSAGINSTGTNTLNLLNGGSSSSSKFITSSDLTIATGTSLSLGTSNLPLQVNGNVSLGGTGSLTLSSAVGGDIFLTGNWSRNTGSFLPNARAVTFNGTGLQTMTNTNSGGSLSFDYLAVNNTGGSVQLGSNVSIVNNLQLFTGTLDLNQKTLTISNTSNLELGIGSGSTAESIISSGGQGTISVPATKTVTVTKYNGVGTPAFSIGNNVLLSLSGVFNPGSGLTTFASGSTLQLNSGGSVVTNSPTYVTGSSLIYNLNNGSGAKFNQSVEWPASSFPVNVSLLNNSWVQLTGDHSLAGNLTVTSGALQATGALRTLTMSGTTQTITVSNSSGGAIYGTDNGTNNDLKLTIATGSTTTFTGDATIAGDDEKKFLNIAVNTGGTLALSRGILCKYGTFTVAGTLQINANGYVQATSGAAVSYNSSTGSLTYNNGGSYTSTAYEWPSSNSPVNVTIQNTGTELILNADKTINGALTFLDGGIITTNSYKIIIPSTGNISNTSGHINGNLRRYVPTGSVTSFNLPIGDATNYTPVSIDFAGTVTGTGYLDASTAVIGAAPAVASGLSQTKYLNRKWTVTNSGVSGFTSYNPTFTFVGGDIQGSASTSNFIVRKLTSSTWIATTAGLRTSTSTQCTGLTSFSDFEIGEEGALDHFVFTLSSPQNNGEVFTGTNTLTAKDVGGFTITSFNASADNVTIAANSPLSGAISGLSGTNKLTSSSDFISGVANLTTLLKYTGTSGAGTFTATSSTAKSGTSGSVTINPLSLHHFAISTITTPQTAGTAITGITLTAQDVNNNTVIFTNSVTYSGTAGITGTSAAFTSGQLTGVSVTPTVLGIGKTFIITYSGLTGTSTFDVNPGTKVSFQSGDWNNTSTWTPSAIPLLTDNVTINHSVTVGSSPLAVCNDLLINSGNSVTINNSRSLTVYGSVTNSASYSGLVVKSGGSLIQNSAVLATVERDITSWSNALHGWHFLSSPVSDQAISPAFTVGTPANYDFYTWWEPTNEWVNFKQTSGTSWLTANSLGVTSSATNFIPGKGYLVSYSATSTKQFTGTLNNSDITVSNLPISAGTNKSWHLLGNPFTSAISWASNFWHLNNIVETAKIWNESGASYSDIIADVQIPALNGFMVEVAAGFGSSNSLTIPSVERVHDPSPWYKSFGKPYIVLVANDPKGMTAQESKIQIVPESTTGFDTKFDSHFLAGYAPKFYSIVGDEYLSTNTLPEIPLESVIPFGFVKNDASDFSIELKQSIDGYTIYLKDQKTNADQNLSENPIYTFTSDSVDDPNRFLLHFLNTTGIAKPTASAIKVYSSTGKINISGMDGKAEILVRNMVGQVVLRGSVNGESLYCINSGNLPVGVYVVSVVSGKQTVSEKVVIK